MLSNRGKEGKLGKILLTSLVFTDFRKTVLFFHRTCLTICIWKTESVKFFYKQKYAEQTVLDTGLVFVYIKQSIMHLIA